MCCKNFIKYFQNDLPLYHMSLKLAKQMIEALLTWNIKKFTMINFNFWLVK